MGEPFFLAIVGGSASGKTALARAVFESLPPGRAALVREDDYYLCSTRFPGFDPAQHNFDEPAAKEQALLASHLVLARMGKAFARPVYDFATHRRKAETVPITPVALYIVEGLHLMASPVLAAHFDAVVFVDTAEAVRLARRVARDTTERGRTEAFVQAQFQERVAPMHALHVAPQKALAHLTVNGEAPLPALTALVRGILPERLKG